MENKPKFIAQKNFFEMEKAIRAYAFDEVVFETIKKTIDEWNWDYYRRKYEKGEYTYEQLERLNDIWHWVLPDTEGSNAVDCNTFSWWLEGFVFKNKKPVVIGELGSGKGYLANYALKKYGPDELDFWVGSDISKLAMKKASIYLEDHIGGNPYRWGFVEPEIFVKRSIDMDVFVTTHTLEHFNESEIIELLENLHYKNIKYHYHEIQQKKEGGQWLGGGSSHVLTSTHDKLISIWERFGYHCGFRKSHHRKLVIGAIKK